MQTEATSLAHMLYLNSLKYGQRTAIQFAGKEGLESLTYEQMWRRVRGFAGVLISLGVKQGDKVVIFSENCPEWPILDFAISSLGATSVAIYPTLPPDQAQYIVSDSEAKVAVCGSEELLKKISGMDSVTCRLLRGPDSIDEASQSSEIDEENWLRDLVSIDPNSLYTLIYTSGTTGLPKGAMLSHRVFLHITIHAKRYLELDHNDVVFSFLPLSHVFERIASMLTYRIAGTIGFNKSLMTVASDLVKIRPTLMAAVPRFLESFRDKVLDGVSKAPPIRQKLFAFALAQGVLRAQGKFAPFFPITDRLVGSKVRERLGGRFRFFISGGAALPRAVAEFYLAMGIQVLQGYGLTETGGGTCINHPTRNKYWTVGEPLGMELKIAEDGEILLRGAGLMDGYYKLAEETAKAIDSDGWFHTGDIGEMEGKSLKITDRKKDLIVLGNGKNIAPQPIENMIRESAFIAEAVVLGDGREHCIALIVPNGELVRKELGLSEDEVLSQSSEVKSFLKKEIDRTNKQVAQFEMVKKFAVLDKGFSIESGELTPTLKVKRKVITERYADVIAAI